MIPGVVEKILYAISRCPTSFDILRVNKTPKTSGHCSSVYDQLRFSQITSRHEERTAVRILSRYFCNRVANLVSYTIILLGAQRFQQFLSDRKRLILRKGEKGLYIGIVL